MPIRTNQWATALLSQKYALTSIDLFSPENLAGYVATAVVAILGFLITWFILKKLLFKPMKNLADQRADVVKQGLDEVEQLKQAALARAAELDTREKEIELKYAEKMAEASKNAQAQYDKIVGAARTQAEQIVAKAEKTASLIRSEEEQVVAEKSAALSFELISALMKSQEHMDAGPAKEDELKAMVSRMLEKKV